MLLLHANQDCLRMSLTTSKNQLFSLLLSGKAFEYFIAQCGAVTVSKGIGRLWYEFEHLTKFGWTKSSWRQTTKYGTLYTICLWLEHDLPALSELKTRAAATVSGVLEQKCLKVQLQTRVTVVRPVTFYLRYFLTYATSLNNFCSIAIKIWKKNKYYSQLTICHSQKVVSLIRRLSQQAKFRLSSFLNIWILDVQTDGDVRRH